MNHVVPVEQKLPVVVAFEKWWLEQRDALEMSPAMKFAAWSGWLANSKTTPPEVARRPVGWVVAVGGFAEGTLRVYGPHYRTREAAEQDADLIKARGEQVEVWDCFAASPLGGKP